MFLFSSVDEFKYDKVIKFHTILVFILVEAVLKAVLNTLYFISCRTD